MNQKVPPVPVAPAAGNRGKVFVSYSRTDTAFAQMLVEALSERGFDAFLDKTDIAPGEPWKERLAELIAIADTVVFAASPDSIASPICSWELEESTRLGKRVIPVVARRFANADAPTALGRLNWVFLAEGDDKDAALATLNTALQTDLPWVREHTRLGELARHWEEQRRGNGATLRSADLDAAERWLDRRPADATAPTELHQDFIRASRRAATARQRYWVAGSVVVAIVAIALAGFAEINRRDAQTQRDRAERTLALATGTANGLVFGLAQKFRDVAGVPAATIKDILDRALKLQEQLVSYGETGPELRQSHAAALGESATTLLTLGDTQGALAAAKQAQSIMQDLVATAHDNIVWQSNLSMAYAGVGDVLKARGDLPGALKSYQASLAIIQRLADAGPQLAGTHKRIGDVEVLQGNLPEALKSYQTSLNIMEQLTRSNPGNTDWQSYLSTAYITVGDVLVAQGNLPEALKSYQANLAIMERLTKGDPGNTQWQSAFSVSYIKVGDVLVAQGNLQEALKSDQASLAIMDRLANSDPGNFVWQRALSMSDNKVGDVLTAQSNLAEALKSFQEGFAIRNRLAKADPRNSDWQYDLGISHERIGDVLRKRGDLAAALNEYEAKRAIMDRLARADPGNSDWQRDLSVSDEKLGDVQMEQHNLAAAQTYYQANLAIRERLAKDDPSNVSWQRDLSISNERLGDLYIAQGNLPAALEQYSASLSRMIPLRDADPSNMELQRFTSVTSNNVGDVQLAQGNLRAALASYQMGLIVIDRLAKSNSGNAGWQHDLVVSYDKIGDVQVRQGNVPAALASYQMALAVMDRLAKSDLGNASWQHDLIVVYVKTAQFDPSEAKAMLTRAAEIVNQMRSRGQLAPSEAWISDDLARRIAALPK